MTVKVFRDDDANAVIIEVGSDGAGGMRFNNELRAIGNGDAYPNIQDNVGTAHFVMYNMTAADIVNDVP